MHKLFGQNISHLKAPVLHNFIFKRLGLGFHYEIFDSEDVNAFLELISANKDARFEEDLVFNGAVVTMLYNVRMCEHDDLIDGDGKVFGAINTIHVRFDENGKALNIGTNTDTFGVRDAFLMNALPVVERSQAARKPELVYGGGGACRSASYSLHKHLGCEKVYVVNRFAQEIETLIESMKGNGFEG